MTACVVVMVTVPSRPVARQMSRELVEGGWAACVNSLGPVESVYRWKGKVEKGREILLMMKTTANGWPRLRREIRRRHPYEVPEMLVLPVRGGWPPYLSWVKESVGGA